MKYMKTSSRVWLLLMSGLLSATAGAGSPPGSPQSASTPPQVPAKPTLGDKDFEAEWHKLRRTNPADFEKRRQQFLLMAQIYLGHFGYGTVFTGTLDARTRQALQEYQAHNNLAITGDVDPQTIDQLIADEKLLNEPELFMPPFSFHDASWDEGAFSAAGSWLAPEGEPQQIQASSIECYRELGLCIDGQAHLSRVLGSLNLVGKFEAYRIERWDKFEIVAESVYEPFLCERNTLQINRQEKSISLNSTPAYRNDKACRSLLGSPRTVTYRLRDGKEIWEPLAETRKSAVKRILRLTHEAWQLMKRE